MPDGVMSTQPSKFAEELENGNDGNNDSRKTGSDRNPANGLFFKMLESFAEGFQLSLHAIATVLSPDDDFERKEAAVKKGEFLADRFLTCIAVIGRIRGRAAHFSQ